MSTTSRKATGSQPSAEAPRQPWAKVVSKATWVVSQLWQGGASHTRGSIERRITRTLSLRSLRSLRFLGSLGWLGEGSGGWVVAARSHGSVGSAGLDHSAGSG